MIKVDINGCFIRLGGLEIGRYLAVLAHNLLLITYVKILKKNSFGRSPKEF